MAIKMGVDLPHPKSPAIPSQGKKLDTSHFLLGAGIVGILTTCWQYIRTFAWKFCNLLIREVQISGNSSCPASTIFIEYFEENFKRSKIYDYIYFLAYERNIKSREHELIACERVGSQTLIYWNRWIPFIYQVGSTPDENGQNAGQPKQATPGGVSNPKEEPNSIRIFYIRGMLDIDKIIKEATGSQNEKANEDRKLVSDSRYRFCIYHYPGDEGGFSCTTSGIRMAPELHPWYTKRINRLLTHKSEELGHRREGLKSCLDSLYFPNHIKELIEEIKMWRDSKDWHEQRNIPYQRGWLLYGPGGTGKTELARAFGQDLDMPILSMNLAQMTNETFQSAWNQAKYKSPCIVLFEDFDNVFHGRENITASNFGMYSPMIGYDPPGSAADEKQTTPASGKNRGSFCVTFDTLLNCIDGVDKGSGIFLIITTNDLSKIDEALGVPRKKPDGSCDLISTRPGRIDRAIELTYMETDLKREMARDCLAEFPEHLAEFLREIDANPDYKETPAQVKYRLSQIALKLFFDQKKGITNEEQVETISPSIQIPIAAFSDGLPGKRIRKKWFRKQKV